MSGARCDATIWPSWADRWIPCPGSVNSDGSCTAYGSQHQQQAPDPAPAVPDNAGLREAIADALGDQP